MGFVELVIAGLLLPVVDVLAHANAKAYWLYLASAALIALGVYFARSESRSLRGAVAYLVPKSLYTHVSARADYKIWFANSVLLLAVLLPNLVVSGQLAADAVQGALAAGLGATGLDRMPGWGARLAFTAAELVAIDGAFFFAHYLQHRVPVLWEFHKTHHSAEVLVPFTVFRMHPVDLILHFSMVGMLSGGVAGLFSWLYAAPVTTFAVNGLNIGMVLFYAAGVHLRHSHVWLLYPRWIAKHISCPALHQVHHSADPRHADRNMGQIFNFWDRLFGTFYLPEAEEQIRYGLSGDEHVEYHSLAALYLLPFKKAFGLLGARRAARSVPEDGGAAGR